MSYKFSEVFIGKFTFVYNFSNEKIRGCADFTENLNCWFWLVTDRVHGRYEM